MIQPYFIVQIASHTSAKVYSPSSSNFVQKPKLKVSPVVQGKLLVISACKFKPSQISSRFSGTEWTFPFQRRNEGTSIGKGATQGRNSTGQTSSSVDPCSTSVAHGSMTCALKDFNSDHCMGFLGAAHVLSSGLALPVCTAFLGRYSSFLKPIIALNIITWNLQIHSQSIMHCPLRGILQRLHNPVAPCLAWFPRHSFEI